VTIRSKIILVFIPLIIAPLLLTAVAASLSARNGITAVATAFLRFKSEQLVSYANGQWRLLLDNNLAANPEFVSVAEAAVASYARTLERSDTELIVAVDKDGKVAMTTRDVEIPPDEIERLALSVAAGAAGWKPVRIAGADRVAQVAAFPPFGWTIFVSETRDAFYGSVNQILEQTGMILGSALAVSLVLMFFFAAYLTRPLREVADAMSEIITSGDLSRQVEVLYNDETGKLGHTFNLMTRELDSAYDAIKGIALKAVIARNEAVAARNDAVAAEEREKRIRNVFQKYVPNAVIDQFIAHPEAAFDGDDAMLAILFSDIRSFTTISEGLPPKALVESLNRYFDIMVKIIVSHHGVCDKYIGDAIMALYGAPERREPDDTRELAVLSALDMLEALDDFNAWQRGRERKEFRFGIGINYGNVTVGNIGSDLKMDYTVIGDMVNLASRLEGLTKQYHEPIIVSQSVQRSPVDGVRYRLLDRVRVKGKTVGWGIYRPGRNLAPDQADAWDLHEDGWRLYYDRSFSDAAIRFREVQRLLPGDYVSGEYLKRCELYIAKPPGEGWDGVIEITEK
jgi:adenylate cyclase